MTELELRPRGIYCIETIWNEMGPRYVEPWIS